MEEDEGRALESFGLRRGLVESNFKVMLGMRNSGNENSYEGPTWLEKKTPKIYR